MNEQITPRQFREADAVEDWRAPAYQVACAPFLTDPSRRVSLVVAIGRFADAANHHPDVDLRYAGVTVSLMTHDVGGL